MGIGDFWKDYGAVINPGMWLTDQFLHMDDKTPGQGFNEDMQRAALQLATDQFEYQKLLGREGIQMRAKDALKAGIHPLASLGASVNYSPLSYNASPTYKDRTRESGMFSILAQAIPALINAAIMNRGYDNVGRKEEVKKTTVDDPYQYEKVGDHTYKIVPSDSVLARNASLGAIGMPGQGIDKLTAMNLHPRKVSGSTVQGGAEEGRIGVKIGDKVRFYSKEEWPGFIRHVKKNKGRNIDFYNELMEGFTGRWTGPKNRFSNAQLRWLMDKYPRRR